MVGHPRGPVNAIGEPKYLTRSPLPSVDWDSFFAAVNDAFNLQVESSGPPGQKAPVFVADYPKDTLGNPVQGLDVILFEVVSSKMAGTDPSGKRRIPKGPTWRETIPHPTKERYSLVTIGWWELMTARFTIYSDSHDRANKLASWFHQMMMRYTFELSFFRARGVQYMIFLERGRDTFSRVFGQELHSRTFDYGVRLELLHSFESKDLESVVICLPEQEEFTVEEQYTIPQP